MGLSKRNSDLLRARKGVRFRVIAAHLDQYFEADRPNWIWMADLTYIPTRKGWLYLAAVMDLCTRKIVGLSIRDSLATELVIESLFHTLKVERVKWKKCRTQAEATEDLTWWIESWYDRRQLHSSRGHVPPIEYEKSKKVA